MGETLFKLTYRVDAMIPVEVVEPSPKVTLIATNSELMIKEIDFSNKAREMAHIREKELKQRVVKRYNSTIVPHKFEEGDLILRCANIKPPTPSQGKLVANWEGPCKIVEVLGKRDI